MSTAQLRIAEERTSPELAITTSPPSVVYTLGVRRAQPMAEHHPEDQVVKEGDLVLPKWFLTIVAVFVLPVMPVALWMSSQIYIINDKIETLSHSNAAFLEHITDPDLHHAAFRVLHIEVDALEKRIEALEKKQ